MNRNQAQSQKPDPDTPRDTRESPSPSPPGSEGTTDQSPRWEGPPELRPPGYLPALDDPAVDRDAAGENLADPDKSSLADMFATGDGEPDRHRTHVRLRPDELIAENLEDAPVYGPDDEQVGVVFKAPGRDHVIVDVGGILGIGSRQVAVRASELDFMRDEDGNIHATTSRTLDELKELPEYTG